MKNLNFLCVHRKWTAHRIGTTMKVLWVGNTFAEMFTLNSWTFECMHEYIANYLVKGETGTEGAENSILSEKKKQTTLLKLASRNHNLFNSKVTFGGVSLFWENEWKRYFLSKSWNEKFSPISIKGLLSLHCECLRMNAASDK